LLGLAKELNYKVPAFQILTAYYLCLLAAMIGIFTLAVVFGRWNGKELFSLPNKIPAKIHQMALSRFSL
jgi:hypothetical protein